jgi:carbamoyl-phosphate synthase large subunit
VTTILVSAAGAPGTAALVNALRENGEREVRVVGTDMADRSAGRHIADAFHLVPSGSDPGFADAMLDVVERESVDAILPQSSFDLLGLAEAKDRFEGVAVMVSSPEAIRRSNDKAESYALLDEIGVPGPRWRRVVGGDAVAEAARELGYPGEDVRPGVAEALRLEELVELLGDDETPLLVMELASGLERTIDGIAEGGRILLGHPKTRESMRAGLAMYFATLDDPWLMEISARIVDALAIDHFFNIQLVGDKVIEINPRISTIVYQEDLNLPWLGVKHALGEISAEELGEYQARVRPTRRALRYFNQVEWDDPE